MTDYELFSAAVAVLSCCAAVASSIAACMASASAKSSRLAQAQSDRRFQKTTIARLGAEILSMGRSLELLCVELRLQYDSLATFLGQLGGSRNALYKNRIEENKQKVVDIIDGVFDEGHDDKFSGLTDVEIEDLLIRYTVKHEDLMGLTNDLYKEQSEVINQLKPLMEKVISQ